MDDQTLCDLFGSVAPVVKDLKDATRDIREGVHRIEAKLDRQERYWHRLEKLEGKG